MADIKEFFQLFQTQMDEQRRQTEALVTALTKGLDHSTPKISFPMFSPFDSTSELWTDYWARFQTFVAANAIPGNRVAQIFVTNQTKVTYKLLSNMASQQSPAKDINELSIDDIAKFMWSQFDPTRYIVHERFKFWSDLKRRPGESILELAARIRHDAVTSVLKALFKIKDAELTFAKAISVAVETVDAAKVAKETVYGSSGRPVGAVNKFQDKYPSDGENSRPKAPSQRQKTDFPKGTCPRCGKMDHSARDCPFKEYICNFCKKTGHLQSVCLQKRKDSHSVKVITKQRLGSVKRINSVPQLQQEIQIRGQQFTFEVDTGAGDNVNRWDVIAMQT
eukprot:Em0011g617a